MDAMTRRSLLILALLLVGAGIFYLEAQGPPRIDQSQAVIPQDNTSKDAGKAAQYARAKEFVQPSGFLNTEPFQLKDVIGEKVVLIDFWTYSCINCQRTFPYLKDWWNKYEDDGLLIVGVHTPEFGFEEKRENVEQAVDTFNITYPVVMDNQYGTWQAYQNQYWPRKYLIDIDGYVVYDHIGEGGYQETEQKIRELLEERAEQLNTSLNLDNDMAAPEDAESVDFRQVNSPETYFGASRNRNLGNGQNGVTGVQNFTIPSTIRKNTLYLDGAWNIHEEYATPVETGRILFRYDAKNVFMVLEAETRETLNIQQDGAPLTAEAMGRHTYQENGATRADVQESTLYRLVENPGYGEHVLNITVPPGVQVYTFTFG